ncbi:MAG: hypothetical protein R3250_05345, partial [Melioribacteraceae bacterium]|nr:hypothetical protein [Melioribacteraceae bacterium]
MINPFVKNVKSFSIYLLSWILIFLVHSSILFYIIELPILICLADSLAYNLLFMILGLSFWYSTKFISFEIYSSIRIVTNHLTAAFFASGIWIALGYLILSNIFQSDRIYLNFLYDSLVWRFFIGMLYYLIIVAIIYIII